MENAEKYTLLQEGDIRLPSTMGVIPADAAFVFDVDYIRKALEESKNIKLLEFDIQEKPEFARLHIDAKIEYLETAYHFELFVCNNKELSLDSYSFANHIEKEDFELAKLPAEYLELSMYFSEDTLTSFLLQLKLLDLIVPNASLVVDFSSLRLLSAKWLKLAASSATPPSPSYLYTIHCIYNDDEKTQKKSYWFHTHGLHRCGIVELEVLNFSNGYQELNTLLEVTVKKFMADMPLEKERFEVGYDGMGLNLCWMRWEEALQILPADILGGKGDRYDEGESNIHGEPSGILFAVEDGNMISPEIYVKTLQENPIYYITNEETLRMSLLAKERFSSIRTLFAKHYKAPEKKSLLARIFKGKEKEDAENWTFLVKLGLIVDNAASDNQREHVWFKLQKIEGNQLTGELLNQPYWVASLNEGDVKTYPLDILTDWLIYTPDSTVTPDTIYELI